MPTCRQCKQSHFGMFDLKDGMCRSCREATVSAGAGGNNPDLAHIMLTTETAPALDIAERLEIVSAEIVFGMNLFKDVASAWRDTFGGRTKTMEDAFRTARQTALGDLRREAARLGADAVVAIDLDYSEISGAGRSMLFLVASGTAVRLAAPAASAAAKAARTA